MLRKVVWSEEEDEYLKNNYQTEDVSKISNKLNRSKASVIQRATKFGVKKNGLPLGITVDDLIRKYKELQSLRKVGKVLGIHKSKVGYYLKKVGEVNKPIEYIWDDNYFSQDTPEVFYWAGFIAADGCVKFKGNKYKQLSIGLAQKDFEHLKKFKAAINFDGPVHKISRKDYSGCEITISSSQMFDDLARFNIVPRKSLIYTFPKWIAAHQFANHFMRGYNDGDGSFYVPAKRRKGRTIKQLYFSLRGTKEFLSVFNTILETNCEFKKHKEPRLSSGIYCLEFGGTRKVAQIRDFLYEGSTKNTRLVRKYEIAYDDAFVNIPEDYRYKKVIGTNMKTYEKVMLKSMKDGERLGFCRHSISMCCSGKHKYHKGYTWKYA